MHSMLDVHGDVPWDIYQILSPTWFPPGNQAPGAGLGWLRLAWAGLGWSVLDWAGLGWPGLGLAGLGWSGLAKAGLGWPGLVCPGLGWPGLGGWSGLLADAGRAGLPWARPACCVPGMRVRGKRRQIRGKRPQARGKSLQDRGKWPSKPFHN